MSVIKDILPIIDKLSNSIPAADRDKAKSEATALLVEAVKDIDSIEIKYMDSVNNTNNLQAKLLEMDTKNPDRFVSGWRPAIGWVCVIALAYQFIFIPTTYMILSIKGISITAIPSIDGHLYELIFGMLGMSGLRTYEKFKGVASK